MKKVLPVNDNPPLKAHQLMSLPLSIILALDRNLDWFNNEFTQIYSFDLDDREIGILYYDDTISPLSRVKIVQNKLELGGNIAEFFKTLVANEHYIIAYVDDFYVKKLNIKHHRYHDLLIYGFDDEIQSFLVKAQIKTKLCDFAVPYSEIIEAYNSSHIAPLDPTYSIFLYKFKPFTYGLNIERLKWHLLDYMESIDTQAREMPGVFRQNNIVWGISTTDRIKECYSSGMFCSTNNIYCWYEHKQHMLNKLIYFNDHSELVCNEKIREEMKNICAKAEDIFKLCLKENIRIKNNLAPGNGINLLCEHLDKIKSSELETLNRFYDNNKNIFERI